MSGEADAMRERVQLVPIPTQPAEVVEDWRLPTGRADGRHVLGIGDLIPSAPPPLPSPELQSPLVARDE